MPTELALAPGAPGGGNARRLSGGGGIEAKPLQLTRNMHQQPLSKQKAGKEIKISRDRWWDDPGRGKSVGEIRK